MKRMLINAIQPEELRVALVDDSKLYDLDIETRSRVQKKANIYKGRITRIEPSLDAAFIDFGAERHGFLPFKEIARTNFKEGLERRPKGSGRLTIKDAVEVGQEILIQVDKEERGNKGAALTNFISLAGRYLVLMPNNPRAGGISRRIEGDERSEIRDMLSSLNIPQGMGVIVRTAGVGRSTEELEWDLNYLLQLWQIITNVSQEKTAPCHIFSESNVIIRAIRDYFKPEEIEEILIDAPSAFEEAKQFVTQMMPEYLDRLKFYDDSSPLFDRFRIESQIETAFEHEVVLPSGGSIVIDPTEALVSIDINSARATSGSDIEETALTTNLEAVDEIARQLRLRDIGGLIVIDYIDMLQPKNKKAVEDATLAALKKDRARVQFGRISRFGLLEMSRQRLRPSLGETSAITCPRCKGRGLIRNIKSHSLSLYRRIQQEAIKDNTAVIRVVVPITTASYILNEKRRLLSEIEDSESVKVIVEPDSDMETPEYRLHRIVEDGEEYISSSELQQPEKSSRHYHKEKNKPADTTSAVSSPAIQSMPEPSTPPPLPQISTNQTGSGKPSFWQRVRFALLGVDANNNEASSTENSSTKSAGQKGPERRSQGGGQRRNNNRSSQDRNRNRRSAGNTHANNRQEGRGGRNRHNNEAEQNNRQHQQESNRGGRNNSRIRTNRDSTDNRTANRGNNRRSRPSRNEERNTRQQNTPQSEVTNKSFSGETPSSPTNVTANTVQEKPINSQVEAQPTTSVNEQQPTVTTPIASEVIDKVAPVVETKVVPVVEAKSANQEKSNEEPVNQASNSVAKPAVKEQASGLSADIQSMIKMSFSSDEVIIKNEETNTVQDTESAKPSSNTKARASNDPRLRRAKQHTKPLDTDSDNAISAESPSNNEVVEATSLSGSNAVASEASKGPKESDPVISKVSDRISQESEPVVSEVSNTSEPSASVGGEVNSSTQEESGSAVSEVSHTPEPSVSVGSEASSVLEKSDTVFSEVSSGPEESNSVVSDDSIRSEEKVPPHIANEDDSAVDASVTENDNNNTVKAEKKPVKGRSSAARNSRSSNRRSNNRYSRRNNVSKAGTEESKESSDNEHTVKESVSDPAPPPKRRRRNPKNRVIDSEVKKPTENSSSINTRSDNAKEISDMNNMQSSDQSSSADSN